jgi:hypothetical protein
MGTYKKNTETHTKNGIKLHRYFPSFQSLYWISFFVVKCIIIFLIPSVSCDAVTKRIAETSRAVDVWKIHIDVKERHSHLFSIILSTRGGGSSNSTVPGDADDDKGENSIDVRVSQGAKNTSTSTYYPSAGKIEKSNDAAAATACVSTSKSMQTPEMLQSLLDDKQDDTFIPSKPTMPAYTENSMTSIPNAAIRGLYCTAATKLPNSTTTILHQDN